MATGGVRGGLLGFLIFMSSVDGIMIISKKEDYNLFWGVCELRLSNGIFIGSLYSILGIRDV